MANLSDITTTPLSGLTHIDALLDTGPDWNYLTGNPANTLYYTFNTQHASATANAEITGGVQAFSASQQTYARGAMAYLSKVTGIQFVETSLATAAQVHFVNANVLDAGAAGETSWKASYTADGNGILNNYDADAIIYLDNAQYAADNADLAPAGYGYETLLHELGHMLGLKHPFEGSIRLPEQYDTTAYTLMSYTYDNYIRSEFSEFDIDALDWLYGGDGLRGANGLNSTGGIRLTGDYGDNTINGGARPDILQGGFGNDVLTAFGGDDALVGGAGNDVLAAGAGSDLVLYGGLRSDYTITRQGSAYVVNDLLGWDGTDTLTDVERIRFADKTVSFATDALGSAAYRLYQAAFNRAPDEGGLGFWIDKLEHGMSLTQIAAGFMMSPEFVNLYGSSTPVNDAFVTRLYHNVLHREPEPAGFAYWMTQLGNGTSQAQVLMSFSESPENQAAVVGILSNGFDYVPA
ncbi:DUF4214 domain-containing protein [Massilia sp. YMA4]|uniref:DUF4214 domain-containing protein n=1 Tax=Massilia sp. YMA4 TaxID=1593482 RepID=UPI000DD11DE0|nr:DUF4214 domain-containing protein [Massilia sp. YMA4]AXA93056.1 hypothetical protein DPH57_19075 [Massilia sp. YMA4]